MSTIDRTMKKVYVINDTLLFEPDLRRLGPLDGYPQRATTLHGPVSECLLLLLENNNQVVTQRVLFASIWEKQGAIVSTNALYQTISQIRKALKFAGLEENIIKTLPKEGFKSIAQLREGELDEFIRPQTTAMVSVLPEEYPVAEVTAVAVSEVIRKPSFFPAKLAYGVAGVLFLLSCAISYFLIKEDKSSLTHYQSVSQFNGCDVYSSWRDKEKTSEMLAGLAKRYPIQCKPGGVLWMTSSFSQQAHSVIICDRPLKDKNAQCDSIIYRPQNHDDE